ncbi:VPLPA-CTERM-specific exosortase XrtD [Celeribacter sp.]|uniref:VPLPA-CTERM-specific exosortase XrtD n=1 Tax=Celeribacter sp. TaxID=1890673 RepID=UPI003A8FA669
MAKGETLTAQRLRGVSSGVIWLVLALIGAALFFHEGVGALLTAWATPEYSHGPIIPLLSGVLLLRELKDVPVQSGAVNRAPGVALLIAAVAFATVGKLAQIDDVVAYATILWVGALLLISFGWKQGKHFWPAVLHLVYMLPLPGVFYYKLSTFLQGVSSELGVWMLQGLSVPVFLEGNIIELDTIKLHVAEACSGLRYLFPILSFSYVFAVLYRGPRWHRAVLLIAAAPITVLMNAVRIAIAGLLVKHWGADHLEGFSHFFEGWVIFMSCVVLLMLLAWALLWLRRDRVPFFEAFDLTTDGMWEQVKRINLIEPSRALMLAALVTLAGAAIWQIRPEPVSESVEREPFALFPREIGGWSGADMGRYDPAVEQSLAADDYVRINYVRDGITPTVEFFAAFYADQTKGGTHSPEICLPSAGWEIARIERVDLAPQVGFSQRFNVNRALIQKGEARMLAYYWFEQHGRHVAWDFEAKMMLFWDGLTMGRTDGALVRLITPIGAAETEAEAEARLSDMFVQSVRVLPRFVPVAEAFTPIFVE